MILSEKYINIKYKKLNLGCGTDYRNDFLNIDGSATLEKVDMVVDLSSTKLTEILPLNHFEYVVANDIIEHHYHWEAVNLMRQIYDIMVKFGVLSIRVPDAKYIINCWSLSVNQKITLLFGGQDIPQNVDERMEQSRKQYPQYFCHKFGWTQDRMKSELMETGFEKITTRREGTNFVATATK